MRRLRRHLSFANVVSALALFASLALGTAWASHEQIFSSDIVDDQVKSADVRNDSLAGGGLTGGDIRPNAIKGADVDEMTLVGPGRAYGLVNLDATVDESRSHGITDANVTDGGSGTYCFDGLAFTPENVQVTPQLTAGGAHALGSVAPLMASGCPAGQASVFTTDGSDNASDRAFFVVFR